MRQQSRFLEYASTCAVEVVERSRVPRLLQEILHFRIDGLRSVPEAEQNLGAAHSLAAANDIEDLIQRHVFCSRFSGGFSKRAITAEVAAEIGQGNEHLGREGDNLAFVPVPQRCSSSK